MFLLVADEVCSEGSPVKHSQCFNGLRSLSHIKCFMAELCYTKTSQRHLWTLLRSDMKWAQKGTSTFMGLELFIVWTLKELLNTRVQSDFANVNFSRDFWDLRKNCWWLLHLASIFFCIWKTCTVASIRGMCGVRGSRLCSRHSKKTDPVYCYKRHIRKIKGGKYHLIDKQLYPAWHFSNPSRTHIPEVLWVSL